jgi:hypothetical protein
MAHEELQAVFSWQKVEKNKQNLLQPFFCISGKHSKVYSNEDIVHLGKSLLQTSKNVLWTCYNTPVKTQSAKNDFEGEPFKLKWKDSRKKFEPAEAITKLSICTNKKTNIVILVIMPLLYLQHLRPQSNENLLKIKMSSK